MKFLICADNTPSKIQKPSDNKAQYQTWEALFWVIGQVVQETPKASQSIPIALSGPHRGGR